MKKFIAVMMIMAMSVGCAPKENLESTPQTTPTESNSENTQIDETKEQPFVLKHTEDLVERGYADITLEEMPGRVVCMTTYPILTLHDMGVNLVAVPQTSTMEYPSDLNAEILPGAMSENFDLETIIELEPDLVMMPETSMSKHGKTLQDAGIPVYAVGLKAEGKSTYEFIKEQTQVFTIAFAHDEASKVAADELNQRFVDLEKKIEEVKPTFEGKTFLGITVTSNTDFYIQKPGSTIGSIMEMLGFENLYTDNMGSTATLNLESVVGVDSDLVLFTTQVKTPEEAEKVVNDAIAANEVVWNGIPAVERGDTLPLTATYIVTAGVKIIDNIYAIIELLEGQFQ